MDLTEVLIIVAAISLGSFIKGVTGSGLPMIAIPVIAIFLGVERSVVVMAIPGVLSNTWLLWRYRAALPEARDLPVFLLTGTVGAVAGTWLLKELDPRILSAVLAVLLTLYIVLRSARPNFALSPRLTKRLAPPVGLAGGLLQGATGISAPVVTTYLHSYRYEPRVFVAALVTVFQVFAVVQLIALIGVGLLTVDRLVEGGLALIPMALFLPLGSFAATRMSQRTFDLWVLGLLVASAGKLIHSAIWG